MPQLQAFQDERGQYWGRGSAQVHPDHKDGVFQFVFNVKNKGSGSDIRGDIAIDDISLSGDCVKSSSTLPPTEPTTTPSDECLETEVSCQDEALTCVPKKSLCDFVPDCPNGFDEASCGSCTFEENGSLPMECGYEDTSSGAFGWDNLVAGTIANSPSVDHTTNSSAGHYMFVDHTDNLFGETAVLTGPKMGRTNSLCSLEFWYHMSGDRTQTLILYSMVGFKFS